MTKNSIRSRERGVALIITLFALLLLTVIGMGMLVSAGTEGTIHSNYRDKQTALLSSMAGLQEARDRIQPATLNITPPTALPILSAGNIVYIINPKSGETVAPWDPDNKYADTELCQEHILGLSGSLGVRCTSLPLVSTWYTTYDDSLSSAGVWRNTNFGTALDLKWVRISLKANNMTPTAVSGNPSDATQLCWDGAHQILLPAGHDSGCIRFGSVIAINVTDGGANYTSTPIVTIDPPSAGGIQATAHATTTPATTSQVQSVAVASGGSNYATAPDVSFSGGGGTGATAVATFVPPGAPVASASLSTSGTTCYATAPSVSFVGGGGTGALATATLASVSSCVSDVTLSGNCPNHKGETITNVGLTGGGGSGFNATVVFNSGGTVSSLSILSAGNTYSSTPTAVSGISGCGSLTFIAALGKRVSSISLTAGGSGYTSLPTVTLSSGTGTTATQPTGTDTLGTPPANAGQVTGVTVTNGGTGYTSPPTVIFTSLSGSGAVGTATIGTVFSKVDKIIIDDIGRNYTVDPMVTISGGGGSGAQATATLGRGANWGKVYLVTALAETKSGARAMLQMETASQVTGFATAAALVIDGPNPGIDQLPNSDPFYTSGNDANSCSDTSTDTPHPAIGSYDDPNATPATMSQDIIVGALPRPDHYIGEGPTPSVQNVFGSLGETLGTTLGLKQYTDNIRTYKTNVGNTLSLGSAAVPAVNYIDGDLTMNGNGDGYGILVVTGTLTFSGDFHWHGTIFVVGDGDMEWSGGGTGTVQGMVLVAKIWPSPTDHTPAHMLSTLGSPTVHWNGGGNNGIYYDHCWTTNLMSKIPFDAPASTKPLKVLSMRTLPY